MIYFDLALLVPAVLLITVGGAGLWSVEIRPRLSARRAAARDAERASEMLARAIGRARVEHLIDFAQRYTPAPWDPPRPRPPSMPEPGPGTSRLE